ncbi:MAG: glucans biosynthesis glucosyltransferase MdoH [Myxococcales bacterium]
MAAQPAKREELAEANVIRLASNKPVSADAVAEGAEESCERERATSSASASVEHASSHVRARGGSEPFDRAVERVSEYLRAVGLSESARIQTLALGICEGALMEGALESKLPERAVAAAQVRVEAFWHDVFGEQVKTVDPLWSRTFAGALPEVFLGDVAEAQRAASLFGDPQLGRAPTRVQFRDQALHPLTVPRWLVGFAPAVVLTVSASLLLLRDLAQDGLSVLEASWTGLFAFLFGFAALGLSAATYGFAAGLRKRKGSASEAAPAASGDLPRSVLLMPVYHESAEDVFAALMAMRESLEHTPGGDCFEIFVLSDSRDAEKAAEEERAFRRVAADTSSRIPVYYRRRARNDRQKAGNLAEFFERWGHRYTYAVVLDADSLMRGDTLVEMVRRIHADPKVALLQAPLELHRGTTLFARAQQHAASVSGPMFTRGLAVWAGGTGNYYGHNAVVRVQAFLDCCALPELRGEAPLGGHILSHDFVEAALLCRAGWEVRIAHELSGSWEELPPTLSAYVTRDRRWCQGNLQHVKVAMSEGLKPMSRLHMACGVASYLASPLWLAFVSLGVTMAFLGGGPFVSRPLALLLSALTAVVLLGPRLLGTISTLLDADQRRAHGGALRLIASVGTEATFSALLAPLMMLHHTRIVASILSGTSVRWGAQKRKASGEFLTAVRTELSTTLLGVSLVAYLMHAAPQLVWPLSPLWLPWALAIPLAWVASSSRAGNLLRSLGLLWVPSETEPAEIAQRVDDLRALTAPDEAARFRDLVLDPVLVSVHVQRLRGSSLAHPRARADQAQGTAPRANELELPRLRQRALRAGPAGLTAEERRALTRDAESMLYLHREAWQHWPVESWRLSREQPQLPVEPA